MNTNLYTPFLEATRNVFQLMLDISEVEDHPSMVFDNQDTLNISIGITGDMTGEVVYRFPSGTSINMVKIMSGMELDSVDDFVTSAIAEIANIISGNVMTALAGDSLQCDILPPAIGSTDKTAHYAVHNACCLSTSAGNVCLEILLNPSK